MLTYSWGSIDLREYGLLKVKKWNHLEDELED